MLKCLKSQTIIISKQRMEETFGGDGHVDVRFW
jgi:hypothetical protein